LGTQRGIWWGIWRFWASSRESWLQHPVHSVLFLKCYLHGDTTGGRIGSDKPVEIGLHTVILNKVISYLILYKIDASPGIISLGLCIFPQTSYIFYGQVQVFFIILLLQATGCVASYWVCGEFPLAC
jgi:hypothetical protein